MRNLFSKPAKPDWPGEPAEAIAAVFEHLANSRDNTAVLTVDAARNYYAQVTSGAIDKPLIAEVVGDAYLAAADRVDDTRSERLRQDGWRLGESGNWTREFESWDTGTTRRQIADDIVRALDTFPLPAGYRLAAVKTFR